MEGERNGTGAVLAALGSDGRDGGPSGHGPVQTERLRTADLERFANGAAFPRVTVTPLVPETGAYFTSER